MRALLSLAVGSALVVGLCLAGPGVVPRAAASSSGGLTVYLPNITKTLGGPTGWHTPFIVQNVGTAATDLDLAFYSFASGELIARRAVRALGPGTSFAESPNADADLPDGSQFSVVVKSSTSAVVAVVNEHNGSGDRAEAMSYVGLSSGSEVVALPYVAKLANGWLSTFIIQNLSSSTTTANVSFYGSDGGTVASLARTISPGRSAAINPAVEDAVPSGVEMSALVVSQYPVGVVVNDHNDAASVAAPRAYSYDGIVVGSNPAAAPVYLPHVPRSSTGGDGRVLVQNVGQSPATPTLTFGLSYGGTQTITGPTLQRGATWSYDLATAPGPNCSACIREGAHAVTVSGGSFAAVTAVLTATTAMGYAGTTSPDVRLYTVYAYDETKTPDDRVKNPQARDLANTKILATGNESGQIILAPHPGKAAQFAICADGFERKDVTAEGVLMQVGLKPGGTGCPPLPSPSPSPGASPSPGGPSPSPTAAPTVTP